MIKIEQHFDCTQKEFVEDLIRIICGKLGHKLPEDPDYLFRSLHPTERAALHAAEEIFVGIHFCAGLTCKLKMMQSRIFGCII